MSSALVFESRLSYLVLRQEDAVEIEPVIAMQLELSGSTQIYASDASIINAADWSMTIRRHGRETSPDTKMPGSMTYVTEPDRTRCMIDIHQSPERFAFLMEMFKGGHASEITILVDDLTTMADYSKKWDTAARSSMAIKSICFEFPLPQSDG